MRSDSLHIVVHDPATAADEVRAAQVDGLAHLEVWVERSPAKLCSLFAGERCFLVLLRHEGDAGFSSRNLAIEPDDAVTRTFALSNGQVDEYPLHWTYPSAVGWAALERFAETGLVPGGIAWFNDSQDGAEPPRAPLRLPLTKNTPLVRVDFRNDAAWALLCERVAAPVGDFRAHVECVSTQELDGATPAQLAAALPEQGGHSILLVADDRALGDPEHPVLVVDVTADPVRTFRVLPREVWSVENNLSIANMDFDEFLAAVDEDGVFRGFPEER